MTPVSPQFKRVQSARTALLLDQPFFGVLALQLRLVEDPSCPTAYTDGRVLGFSPAFVDTLSQDVLIGLIAHEVMHCALGHPWRKGGREHWPWNVACDYAINILLQDAQFKLPDGGLIDPQCRGRWSEWIYDRLPKQPKGQNGQGSGPEGFGEVREAPQGGSADGQQATLSEADWRQITQQALRQAQARGKLPAGLARELMDAVQPKVDWRSALRRFIQQTVKADYTWTRPNVRYMASGFYLPSLHSHACGRIAVAVDTSGSIDGPMLAQFAAELQSIADEVQPESVDVIYCDAKVHRVDSFARDERIEVKTMGGGGTSFVPVFEYLAGEGNEPVVLVYLTDMEGTFPTEAPDYPVLWANYGRREYAAPFGEVLPCG